VNVARRFFSSTSASTSTSTSTSSFDSPNADVEVDTGGVVPEASHVVVSKEDEKLEENKRRRLSEVRTIRSFVNS
jgi:molybdopterin biosynthesis enzyme